MKLITYLLLSYCTLTTCFAQNGDYYEVSNDDALFQRKITFLANNRFIFSYTSKTCVDPGLVISTGLYSKKDQQITLSPFIEQTAKIQVVKTANEDDFVDVRVRVYALQDSSILADAIVFARDINRQRYYVESQVNAEGYLDISFSQHKTLRYLSVECEGYLLADLDLEEYYNNDYQIIIYLSPDPLAQANYNGPTGTKIIIQQLDENRILLDGIAFRKLN